MSLLPLLFSAWWAELNRPHRLMNQNFGLGLNPDQLFFPDELDRFSSCPYNRAALEQYYRPLTDFLQAQRTGISTITADKDMFKVILDVPQFKPEEISVKLADRFIVVEAKHEEKRDEHGFISRQFSRKYLLPEQADEEKLASNISSDGVLTITAPLKQTAQKPNERAIKIELTGKPAIRTDAEEATPTPTTAKEMPIQNESSKEETTENPKQEKPEK